MKIATWLWDRFIVFFWSVILSGALLGALLGPFDRHPLRHFASGAVITLVVGKWYSLRRNNLRDTKGDLARGANDASDGGAA